MSELVEGQTLSLGEGNARQMEVTAWRGGSAAHPVYGIRVGLANRDRHFPPPDDAGSEVVIEVEVDGLPHQFALTPGFWNKCPEFRDRGSPVIRNWLRRHHRLNWPKGEPPEVRLIRLGRNRFRLLPG
jgi:hypothetical protein